MLPHVLGSKELFLVLRDRFGCTILPTFQGTYHLLYTIRYKMQVVIFV